MTGRVVVGTGWDRVGVLAGHDRRQNTVGSVAAAVVTHIDNQAILAGCRGVKISLKAFQRGLVHGLNVQIAETSSGEFVHLLAALFTEGVVFEPGETRQADGAQYGAVFVVALFTRALEGDDDLLVYLTAQPLLQGFALFEWPQADGGDDIAYREGHRAATGWGGRNDLADAIAGLATLRRDPLGHDAKSTGGFAQSGYRAGVGNTHMRSG